MDTITKSFLNEFSANRNCKHLPESQAFEMFCNFCVVNKVLNSTGFDLFSTSTGKNAQGIDGVAIVVNNKHCTTEKEIQDLIEMNNYLDVDFILVQTKTTPSFDNTKILNFFHYTKHFFDLNSESTFITNEMDNFIHLRNFIFENSHLFVNRNPKCHLYFCTLGNWKNEANLVELIDSNKSELLQQVTFSNISFVPVDARIIQDMYRKTKAPVEATINFPERTFIPNIPNVEMACSGVLPFSEFKQLIIDENGQMKSVFEDNIRDYLLSDVNVVNSDISKTIKSEDVDYFSILNNGVTVVAESIAGASTQITLKNYQIVNGCQTSHVLFENKDLGGIEKINIPLKIIVTSNNDIKSKITRATNNQTQVGIEQLEALTEFQKRLELFFNAKKIPTDYKIYYERRTNQHHAKQVHTFRIITIESQLKSFSAMFKDQPHLVSGHYGKLIRQMGDEIFNESDTFDIYYQSALSYFVIEQMYQKGILDDSYKKYRYHLLMIFRYLVTTSALPPLNSNRKVISFSEKFESILTNYHLSCKYFTYAEKLLLDKENGVNLRDRKASERKSETDKLIVFTLKNNRTENYSGLPIRSNSGQMSLFS